MAYYVRDDHVWLDADGKYWPVMVPPVTSKTGTTMGGPVAYCDTEAQAKQLADLMNAGERVPELERQLAEARLALEAVTTLAEKAAVELVSGKTGFIVTYPDGRTEQVANIALAEHAVRNNKATKYRPASSFHAETD